MPSVVLVVTASLTIPVATTAPLAAARGNGVRGAEKLLVATIVAIFVLLSVRSALLRPFWFDELSTLFVASMPSLRQMFQALPSDGNPPLYFLLVWPLLHLPIRAELALRLPSIIGYALAALTTYQFVRRSSGQISALAAFSMLLASSMQRFAIEGRPYALLLAFTGLTLCFWQAYCCTGKRAMLAGVAFSVAGCILSHQYGLIYALLPVSAGECARTLRRHRLDRALWQAVSLGIAALALTLPSMLRGQKVLLSAIRNCPVFWAHPQFRDLTIYADMAPTFLRALAAMALVALLFKLLLLKPLSEAESTLCSAPMEDFVAATMLALILPVMLIVTHMGTNYFQPRYGIGSAMGISLLAGLLLSGAAREWNGAASLAWAVTMYCLALAVIRLCLAPSTVGVPAWKDPLLRSGNPKEPIVVASALQFSPLWYYSDQTMRPRLHYLSDLNDAAMHSDPAPEYSLALESRYTPMQMDDYQAFVEQHRSFLLYCYGEPRLEWVKQRLLREGWRLTVIRSARKLEPTVEGRLLYRELYQVTR